MSDETKAAVEEAEWMAAQRREADARAVIAVGDVAVLKSGGPPMTVWWLARSGTWVDVVWFADGKTDATSFPLACVRKVK